MICALRVRDTVLVRIPAVDPPTSSVDLHPLARAPGSESSGGDPSAVFSLTLVDPFAAPITIFEDSLAFPDSSLVDDSLADSLFGGTAIVVPANSSLTTSLNFDFPSTSDCDAFFEATGALPGGILVRTARTTLDCTGPSAVSATFSIPEPLTLILGGVGLFVLAGLQLRKKSLAG
jgi:PEP-CTERM motif-containing protein